MWLEVRNNLSLTVTNPPSSLSLDQQLDLAEDSDEEIHSRVVGRRVGLSFGISLTRKE